MAPAVDHFAERGEATHPAEQQAAERAARYIIGEWIGRWGGLPFASMTIPSIRRSDLPALRGELTLSSMIRTTEGNVSIALATAAAACWMASYSWVLGLVVEAEVLSLVTPMASMSSFNISPWLLAEFLAIPLGLASAGVAVCVLRENRDSRRRPVIVAGLVGTAVALLSLLSLASPA